MRGRYPTVISWSSVRTSLGALMSNIFLAVAGEAAADDTPSASSLQQPRPSQPLVVVVLGGDAAFDEALADSLVDNAIVSAGVIATPALGELAFESRRIADERGAVATVWLSSASSGATLVTYERVTDRFLVRELPYTPPLSPTQAAEAARMVRTMLRALRATDDSMFGATMVRPTPTRLPAEPAPKRNVAAFLGVGAWFATPAADAAPHVAPTLVWRPDSLGVALGVALAPAQTLDHPSVRASFRGEVRDVVVALEARYALHSARLAAVVRSLRISPSGGLALHAVSVRGAFDAGDSIRSRRYDPALRAGVTATVPLSVLDVGLGVSADCLVRRQRYDVGMEEILVVPRVQLMLAVIVGIRL